MPNRFRKMNNVITKVRRARAVATALKLAGRARSDVEGDELDWPDLIHTLESILPTTDELGEALADIRQAEVAV